jgi:hypothetical protein
LALLLLAGAALLVLVVGTGLAVRPELWRAGPDFLARALAVGLGTGAATLFPALVAGLAFSLGRSLSPGWELLGLGRLRLWGSLWPLWALCLALGIGLSFVVEPASWARVGEVRGTPLAAKVSWERLQAGEVLTLRDGGWLRLRAEGGLEVRSAEGDMELEATAFRPRPDATAWDLDDVELGLEGVARGQWKIGRMSLSMRSASRERYLAPATSPWALSMTELSTARRDSPRAARVWFRRWLQVLAIPVLSLALWLIAVPGAPRRTPLLGPAVLGMGTVLSFFLVLRLAEQTPFPSAVVLLPLLPALVAVVACVRR